VLEAEDAGAAVLDAEVAGLDELAVAEASGAGASSPGARR
jgi:hypothetical protein